LINTKEKEEIVSETINNIVQNAIENAVNELTDDTHKNAKLKEQDLKDWVEWEVLKREERIQWEEEEREQYDQWAMENQDQIKESKDWIECEELKRAERIQWEEEEREQYDQWARNELSQIKECAELRNWKEECDEFDRWFSKRVEIENWTEDQKIVLDEESESERNEGRSVETQEEMLDSVNDEKEINEYCSKIINDPFLDCDVTVESWRDFQVDVPPIDQESNSSESETTSSKSETTSSKSETTSSKSETTSSKSETTSSKSEINESGLMVDEENQEYGQLDYLGIFSDSIIGKTVAVIGPCKSGKTELIKSIYEMYRYKFGCLVVVSTTNHLDCQYNEICGNVYREFDSQLHDLCKDYTRHTPVLLIVEDCHIKKNRDAINDLLKEKPEHLTVIVSMQYMTGIQSDKIDYVFMAREACTTYQEKLQQNFLPEMPFNLFQKYLELYTKNYNFMVINNTADYLYKLNQFNINDTWTDWNENYNEQYESTSYFTPIDQDTVQNYGTMKDCEDAEHSPHEIINVGVDPWEENIDIETFLDKLKMIEKFCKYPSIGIVTQDNGKKYRLIKDLYSKLNDDNTCILVCTPENNYHYYEKLGTITNCSANLEDLESYLWTARYNRENKTEVNFMIILDEFINSDNCHLDSIRTLFCNHHLFNMTIINFDSSNCTLTYGYGIDYLLLDTDIDYNTLDQIYALHASIFISHEMFRSTCLKLGDNSKDRFLVIADEYDEMLRYYELQEKEKENETKGSKLEEFARELQDLAEDLLIRERRVKVKEQAIDICMRSLVNYT